MNASQEFELAREDRLDDAGLAQTNREVFDTSQQCGRLMTAVGEATR